MKYYVLVDTINPTVTYRSDVLEFTVTELTESINYFQKALKFNDNIHINCKGNEFIIRTLHIVAVSHIKVL